MLCLFSLGRLVGQTFRGEENCDCSPVSRLYVTYYTPVMSLKLRAFNSVILLATNFAILSHDQNIVIGCYNVLLEI